MRGGEGEGGEGGMGEGRQLTHICLFHCIIIIGS